MESSTDCMGDLSLRIDLTTSQQSVITILFSIISPLIVLSNGITIFLLLKLKQLHVTTNRIILCLCISDLLIGVIVCPLWIGLYTVYRNERNCIFETITVFPSITLGHFSVYMITMVAVERYIRITRPLHYQDIITVKKLNKIVVACGCLALCCGSVATTAFSYGYLTTANIVLVTLATIVLCFIFFIYIRLLSRLRRHSRRSVATWTERNPRQTFVMKTFVTAACILLSLFLCFAPCFVFTFINFIYSATQGRNTSSKVLFITLASYPFFYMNSVINAIIVLRRNRPMHDYIARFFRRMHRTDDELDGKAVQVERKDEEIELKSTAGAVQRH